MTDLEQALRQLDVDWPATPDLAAAVMTRVAAEPRAAGGARSGEAGGARSGEAAARRPEGGEAAARRGEHASRRRRLPARTAGWRARVAYVAVAVVVLAAGTLAVSPDARSTVLRWLGLGSVEIRRAPLDPEVGRELDLGRPINLPARVPHALGTPDAAYATPLPGGATATSLVYAGPPTVLVQTFRATVTPFIEKTVSTASQVQRVTVDGAPGYWITGAHGFAFVAGGQAGYEDQRLADRTLLVERDGLLIRVEGALSRERALEIARSIE